MSTAISKNEIDPLDLRRAFGRFGTGVTVITTRAADGTPVTGHFAVNVLTLDQIELSRRFSRSAVDKFAGVAFTDGLKGAPILAGCAASIECTGSQRAHRGRPRAVPRWGCALAHENAAPLLFFNGKYIQGVDLDGAGRLNYSIRYNKETHETRNVHDASASPWPKHWRDPSRRPRGRHTG